MDQFVNSISSINDTNDNIILSSSSTSSVHNFLTNSTIQNNGFQLPTSLLNQKVLISVTGPHGTDIIGCVLECMAKYDYEIEDFTLSRLYHNVTFSVLTTVKQESVVLFRDLSDAVIQWDG